MADSDDTPDLQAARRFAAGSGIEIAEGRLALFSFSMERNRQLTLPVLTHDYGDIEPASRFRAPPSR